ncbi:MoaD/ThiS family protein [Emcibacter sp. SYSU 3D8]|uniref:MoaD/ThiS family protein n=1 Tax=Emcibacter sp. SYSU 3D8 TaxID=3133969 RepID=UPI0031FE9DC1
MAQMFFTQHLRRLVAHEYVDVQGATLRAALGDLFLQLPALRSYILDDQDRLRQHVCIFVDDERIDFRGSLDCEIAPESEIYVMQALSGGKTWPIALLPEPARDCSS